MITRENTFRWVVVFCTAFSVHQSIDGIIAGKYAKEGDYPFAVIIFKADEVICGGVMVSRHHVFTGCHCVGKWTPQSEGSTAIWEPDQTAYDFNISTTRDTVPSNYDGQREINEGPKAHTSRLIKTAVSGTSTGKDGMTLPEALENVHHLSPFGMSSAEKPSATAASMTQTHHFIKRDGEESATTIKGPITTTRTTRTDETTNATTEPTIKNETTTTSATNTTITAATTFAPFTLTEIYMVAGTIWIYKFSRGQLRKAGNSFKHPRCNAETTPWTYDFGIYRVAAPFEFKENRLEPMVIYHKDNEIFGKLFQSMIEGGAICQTIGWGATQLLTSGDRQSDNFTQTAVNMSEKLKHTDVKLVTDEVCNELLCFPPYNFCNGSTFQWAEVGIVCAIHVSGGDSCDVDDGNALVCDGHVFGFVNSGLDCMANVPRFYTRLDFALDFYYSSVNLSSSFNFITLSLVGNVLMVLFFNKKFS